MLMSVADDVTVQKPGLVVVGYEVGEFVPSDHELTRLMIRVVRSIPLRVVGAHTCYSDQPMHKIVDLLVHMVSSFVRLRLRYHSGKYSMNNLRSDWKEFL